MKTATAIAWGVGLAGAGVATYFIWRNLGRIEVLPGVVGPQGELSSPNRVQNMERAANVRPELKAFLEWWKANGPFPILVAPDGGYRTDAATQAGYYAQGLSKAKTLDQTPHGRGAALDLWPVGFDPTKDLSKQPEMKAKFTEMGRIAKAQGFTWGGDWGWDYPHIEVKGWRTLPMAGLSGLGATSSSSSSATLLQQWGLPAVLAGVVVYQVFIRKDEGRRTIGVHIPDPKASREAKKYAKEA